MMCDVVCCVFVFFFFFKQKTAYEMRISDWSSDVCSSDLRRRGAKSRLWRTSMAGWSKAMRRRPRGAGACGAVDPQRDGFGYAIAVIVTSFLPKLGMERLGPRPNEGQDPLIARSRFGDILFRVRRQGGGVRKGTLRG